MTLELATEGSRMDWRSITNSDERTEKGLQLAGRSLIFPSAL